MKQAIIFGAGNIGRGFMGQLFSEAGYAVTFADVDRTLLDALNARRSYTIRLVTNERTDEVQVGPVAALHSGYTPQEILDMDLSELKGLGLEHLLSPNRRSAVTKVPEQIREYARRFLEESPCAACGAPISYLTQTQSAVGPILSSSPPRKTGAAGGS